MDYKVWRKSYKFLPSFLRDWHDQKELFKTIHETYTDKGINKAVPTNPFTKPDGTLEETPSLTWVQGHCYVIDIFLWFMAAHGYTLQKTRTKLEFLDLEKTLKDAQKSRWDSFSKMLEEEK